MDCPQVAPDVYRRCLSAAEAILAAAGFTAQDAFEAKQLMDGWDSEHAGRQPEMSSHEALAAFNLAELAAQAESGQAADCHLFSIFVSGEVLAELGASKDAWLETFAANEQRIAELASIQRRRTKASSVFITSLV